MKKTKDRKKEGNWS